MPYQSMPLAAIPKRAAPVKKFNQAEADELLAVVSAAVPEGASPPTATDGTAYASEVLARAAANKAKRLLNRVKAETVIVKTAVFGLDAAGAPVLAKASAGQYGWAVWLVAAPPEASTPATEASAPAPAKGGKAK